MVRIKHRYLLLNILYPEPGATDFSTNPAAKDNVPWTIKLRQPSSDKLSAKLLLRLIRDGIEELFGDYGSGMAAGSLVVKYLSPATSTAIVRVARAHYKLVWAALTYITQLPQPIERRCVVQVVRVSGTIRKAEEAAIRRARMGIANARGSSGGSIEARGDCGVAGDVDGEANTDMFAGIEDHDEGSEDDEDA